MTNTPTAAIVSFRLGGADGVSVEAAKWRWAFERIGYRVFEVADSLLPGLGIDAPEPPTQGEVEDALAPADVVIVENLCSLPLNPGAAGVVERVLRGRRAILRHHDLPWQRTRFAGGPPPPDDPHWTHVTINDLSRRQLRERGIEATTMYNRFDTEARPGDRWSTRAGIGVAESATLLLQPTRAIARKNVPAAIALAEALGATLWIAGPAEEGYGPVLDELAAASSVRIVRDVLIVDMADAYAAADAVVFPSTWEGFGNPTVESAVHRRPLAVGSYPVLEEIRSFGFEWLPADQPTALRACLAAPDTAVLDRNLDVAKRQFSLSNLPDDLSRLLAR